MAVDDYYVIVYRVLKYLYACLKSGISPEVSKLNPEYLGINESYWSYIVKHLLDDGLIEDIVYTEILDGAVITGIENAKITPKGITYLSENTMIKKVIETLKNIKDIVPGA
jgi:hypothetical protein